MLALKIILIILLVLAAVFTAYCANIQFSLIELPFSLPFALPANMLWYSAGATGLILILLIVVAIIASKKKKKKKNEEVEEVEETEESEVEELEEETPEEEPVVEAAQETQEVEVEEAAQEEAKEEETAQDEQESVEEEPKAEEESQEEANEEEAQEEQPEEEAKEEAESEEPAEEQEEMIAEKNEETNPAPAAIEEEVKEEEEQTEEPAQEEAKEEEPQAEETKEEVAIPVVEQAKEEEQEPQKGLFVSFMEEQKEINKNIEKKLEGIDTSLKIIADALKALLYDTVPAGVTTVSVSTNDVTPAPVAEPVVEKEPENDVADGGDYFEQVEQEQQIEEQNAEIAENYAEGWIATADQESRIKPKMSFDMRLRVADADIKKFYSDIKNELLSYGIHDRISRHRENFNQGRINICRMVINGKTLKVYLAVDPDSIDKRYFHHTDVGHRKGLVELPTMINVRSKVSARKVKELITLMMESLVISKKPYEEHDYAADLTVDGFTTVECKGYDYLVEKSMTLEKAKEYPDNFAGQLLEMVENDEYQERFIKTTITLDDIAAKFKDGDVVDIDKVRELGLGPANSNFLSVKESKKLAKKFKVYANEYTPDAVKMICLSGGEAFLVIQPEKTIEEV